MRKKPVKYKIKVLDMSDFKLELFIEDIDKSLFTKIFFKSIAKLKKKHNVHVNGSIEFIEEFNIPENARGMVFPTIFKALKKNMNIALDDFEKDGFKVLSIKVIDVLYKRVDAEKWDIIITYEGQYLKEEK